MPVEKDVPICLSCKKPQGKSVVQRLEDFLKDLKVTETENVRKAIQVIYRIRAKLTHGGDLLRADLDPWPTGLHPESTSQWQNTSYGFDLARLALVKWLTRQGSILNQ